MKRLYIIALFVFASGFASAQENGNRDAQNRIVRGLMKPIAFSIIFSSEWPEV